MPRLKPTQRKRGALIVGPFGGAQITGSLASVTFGRNRAGAYVRARIAPVNPNTPRQNAIRSTMGTVSSRWTNVLTAAQRSGWDDYAANTPIPNALGQDNLLNGRNMYIRANNIIFDVSGLFIDDAPPTPGVGDPIQPVLTGDTTDGIEITGTDTPLDANDILEVRLGAAVNQSRNFYATPFTFVVALTSLTTFPVTIKPAAEVFVGQRFFTRSRRLQADGKVAAATQQLIDILT